MKFLHALVAVLSLLGSAHPIAAAFHHLQTAEPNGSPQAQNDSPILAQHVDEALVYVARQDLGSPTAEGSVGLGALELESGEVVLMFGGSDPRLEKYRRDGTKVAAFSPALPFLPRLIRPLANGNFLVTGTIDSWSEIIQLRPDGSRVSNFSIRRLANSVREIAQTPDGGLLVVFMANGWDGQLVRFHANGAQDPTFSTHVFGGSAPKAIKVLPDGRILVGGATGAGNALVRLQPDGSVDTSFSNSNGLSWTSVTDLAIGEDNTVYVAGTGGTNEMLRAGIFRLTPDGGVDSFFASGFWFSKICPLRDGSILATQNGVLHRYLPNGQRDLDTFLLLENAPGYIASEIHEMVEASDESLILGGRLTDGLLPAKPFTRGTLETYRALAHFQARHSGRLELEAQWDLLVSRTGDMASALELFPTLQFVTPTNGLRVSLSSDRLLFSPGESNAMLRVAVPDDVSSDPELKIFHINLGAPSNVFVRPILLSVHNDDMGFGLPSETSVGENTPVFISRVYRPTPSKITCTVDYHTTPQAAQAGLDYVDVSGTLVFGPEDLYREIQVPLINDGLTEGNETFLLTLSRPTGGPIVVQPTQQVRIIDNERGYFLSAVVAEENQGLAEVFVTREGDYDFHSTVKIRAENETAREGVDFTLTTNVLHFIPGQTKASLLLAVQNNAVAEGGRYAQLTLCDPSPDIPIAGGANSLWIADDEHGHHFEISRLSESLRFSEGERGFVRILRRGDFDLESTVTLFAFPDPSQSFAARPGVDYVLERTNLVFARGQTERVIEIDFPSDGVPEVTRQFHLQLERGTPSSIPVMTQSIRCLIEDEDQWLAKFGTFETQTFELRGPVVPLPGRRLIAHTYSGIEYFNDNGKVQWRWQSPRGFVDAVAVDSMSRVLLSYAGSQNEGIIRRLLPDGQADDGFAIELPLPPRSLSPQADGKIVVVTPRTVMRFLEDGSGDPEFKFPRVLTQNGFGGGVPGRNGSFYVYSSSPEVSGFPHWIRLTPAGEIDPAFQLSLEGNLTGEAFVDSKGRLLVAAQTPDKPEAAYVRLELSGAVDQSFRAITSTEGSSSLAVMQDDSIYVLSPLGPERKLLKHYSAEGELDTAFGVMTILYTGGESWARSAKLAVWPDVTDRLLVWGRFDSLNHEPRKNSGDLLLPPLGGPVGLHHLGARPFEKNGEALIRVSRASTNSALALDYRTADREARSGVDYEATSGRIFFGSGEADAWIPLTIHDNDEINADRALLFIFSDPARGKEYPPEVLWLRNDDPGLLATLSPGSGFFPDPSFSLRVTGRVPLGGKYVERSTDLKEWVNQELRDDNESLQFSPYGDQQYFRLRMRWP